jgi:hypothetical protein
MNRQTYPRWPTFTLVGIIVIWLIAVPAMAYARLLAAGVNEGQSQVLRSQAPYSLWMAAIALGLPCLAVLVAAAGSLVSFSQSSPLRSRYPA